MGLLSFLSRKSAGDKCRQDKQLVTQPYHGTAAAVAPDRGTYPIGGNGRNDLETLARKASHFSLNAAPPPAVLLLQDQDTDRPTTAPNGHMTMSNWPVGSNRLRQSVLRTQLSLSSTRSTQDSLTTTSLKPEVARTQSRQRRVDSRLSTSGRGFKDILDAQSELKPLDFRSRIQAAGARDYGEDVADRNIGGNGCSLELPQVQRFYAQKPYTDSLRNPAWVSMSNISRPYRKHESLQPSVAKQVSLESGLRTKSLNASSHYSHPRQTFSRAPQLSISSPRASGYDLERRPMTSDSPSRRRTLSTYSQSQDGTAPAATSIRPNTRHVSYRDMPPLPTSPLRISVNPPNANEDLWNNPSSPELPVSPTTGMPKSLLSSRHSPKQLEDSAILTTEKSDGLVRDGNLLSRPLSSQRAFPLKPSSKRKSGAASSIASTMETVTGHSVKPSLSSSTATYYTAVDGSAAGSPRERKRASSDYDTRIDVLPGLVQIDGFRSGEPDPAPSPHIRTASVQLEGIDTSDNYQRTKSLTSSLRRLKTEELSEVVPLRTSSLRNWSISSATPTTSDTSSNPFQRPQSRHTATTSVDLGNTFSIKNSSRSSLDATSVVLRSPRTPKSSNFNIDDYVSSDDDSTEPRRPRGEGEEELVFNPSGYGMCGAQLPGLFDSLTSNPPKPSFATADNMSSSRPRSSASLPPGYLHRAYGGISLSSPRRRRFIIDTAADYDDEEDEEDEDDTRSWHGGDMGLPGTSRHLRATKRLSAIGNVYSSHTRPVEDAIEEERDMSKIDIATAVRMRKEEKARKRAANASANAVARRRAAKGKGKESASRIELDGGHHADVEC